MRYSPYPVENYALSHGTGYINPLGESAEDEAIWNLAWLSIPHIDSYLNLAYEDFEAHRSLNTDFPFRVKVQIVEDLKSRPELRQILTTLSPAEFLKAFTAQLYTRLDLYRHGKDAWLTTVRCRAEAAQARIDIEQLAAKAENVMVVDFKLRNGSLQRIESEPQTLADSLSVDAKLTAESPRPESEGKDENKRFIDHSDGTVTDTHTGRMWMRCAMGQAWNGNACIGKADTFTWEQANNTHLSFAGNKDWRLPDIDELLSIVDENQPPPTININAFPDTSPSGFWSGTSNLQHSKNAWYVTFGAGQSFEYSRNTQYRVRLVRLGIETAKPFAQLDWIPSKNSDVMSSQGNSGAARVTIKSHNKIATEQTSNNPEETNINMSFEEDAQPPTGEILVSLSRIESRFEASINRIETVLAALLANQSKVLAAISQLHHHSPVHTNEIITHLEKNLLRFSRGGNSVSVCEPRKAGFD